jgi:hypothetical protein
LADSGTADYREGHPYDSFEPDYLYYDMAQLIVMEITKPWVGKLSHELKLIEKMNQELLPGLVTVEAWQWKPSHNRKPLPRPCKTQHERDAIRLGMWVHDRWEQSGPLPW